MLLTVEPEDGQAAARLAAVGALALLVAAVALGSVVPFDWVSSWSEAAGRLQAGMSVFVPDRGPGAVAERFLSFVPIGALICWLWLQRQTSRPLAAGLATVVLTVLLIEMAQSAVRVRHPRLADAWIGVAAGVLGVALGARAYPHRGAVFRWLRGRAVILALGLLLAGNFAMGCFVYLAHRDLRLCGWDRRFPLLIANELTGDRPWAGKLRGVALYARSLTGGQIARLAHCPFDAEGLAMRNELGAVALYSFARISEAHVLSQATAGPPLWLSLPDPADGTWACVDQSLEVLAPTLIRSVDTADGLCDAIDAAQALAVETELSSANLNQYGPARIVSISADPYTRNFTLGQEREEIDLRIRAPRMGSNGMNIPMRTHGKVLAGGWHHVVASYARGTVRMFIDGVPTAPELPLAALSYLLFHEQAPVSTGLVLGLVFLVLGAAGTVAFSKCRTPLTGLLAFSAAALPTLLLGIGAAAALDHEYDLPLLAAAIVGTLLGVGTGLRYRRRLAALLGANRNAGAGKVNAHMPDRQ